ncbi:hypothetical protein [[Mycobacterium] wendilense]|uniref:Secreted protein n=1 Tax=[Mycobacterium] wendilense TaxID=3064284 RepID=A0ABN9NZH1_9MYCO|nr:hypothetical protein [Mycolicibacterium sp. MU0050]CAJ1580675.1 hypothetical protein MU0050_001161 [Mycolicibacterium sp. MU0050]
MPARRPRAMPRGYAVAGTAVGAVAAVVVTAASPAQAAPRPWTGQYSMVTYASQKGGTSVAARQSEADFGAVFVVSTSCSGGTCVATTHGPASSNPTVPNPLRYNWDGQQWKATYDWVWQCAADSPESQWSPARSFTYYAPHSDGTLRGMWHTDIASGACRGSVVMPVAAIPA